MLAADAGLANSKVLITPMDFRKYSLHTDDIYSLPEWIFPLYNLLTLEMSKLPLQDH